MSTSNTLFFSYARADAEFALRLAKDLRSAAQEVWLDQLDIPAGARWDQSVEKALHACQSLLVILTPSSVDSSNVMDEVSFAIEEGKRVIPVLCQECKVPFRLRRFHYIDFTKDYSRALALTLNGFTKLKSSRAPILRDRDIGVRGSSKKTSGPTAEPPETTPAAAIPLTTGAEPTTRPGVFGAARRPPASAAASWACWVR